MHHHQTNNPRNMATPFRSVQSIALVRYTVVHSKTEFHYMCHLYISSKTFEQKIKFNRIIECRHNSRSLIFFRSKTPNNLPKMQGLSLASLKKHPSVSIFGEINMHGKDSVCGRENRSNSL